MEKLLKSIRAMRLNSSTEALLQRDLETGLRNGGFSFEREVCLGPRDRVDFLVVLPDGRNVALECKVRGQAHEVYKQLARYAAHERVSEVILLTSRMMTMPPDVCGKALHVVHSARAWL